MWTMWHTAAVTVWLGHVRVGDCLQRQLHRPHNLCMAPALAPSTTHAHEGQYAIIFNAARISLAERKSSEAGDSSSNCATLSTPRKSRRHSRHTPVTPPHSVRLPPCRPPFVPAVLIVSCGYFQPCADRISSLLVVTLQSADMTQEQSAETMEIVVMAIDKFSASANYEVGLSLSLTPPPPTTPFIRCLYLASGYQRLEPGLGTGALGLARLKDERERPFPMLNPPSYLPSSVPPQKAAQMIKEMMDKKFGPAWHVAMGEGYGFDVSYNTRHLLYMFYSGLGILVFKC